MILLIGSEGSMGKRYQAILRHLNVAYITFDVAIDESLEQILSNNFIDRVIIATPTPTHYSIYKMLKEFTFNAQVLCEKPLSTNLMEATEMIEDGVVPMMQYKYLRAPKNYDTGHESSYDFFRSGKDGLAWDCFQIIAFHNGPLENVKLRNDSPVWRCTINSDSVSISGMDHAYLEFLKRWLVGERMEEKFLIRGHKRVLDYISLRNG